MDKWHFHFQMAVPLWQEKAIALLAWSQTPWKHLADHCANKQDNDLDQASPTQCPPAPFLEPTKCLWKVDLLPTGLPIGYANSKGIGASAWNAEEFLLPASQKSKSAHRLKKLGVYDLDGPFTWISRILLMLLVTFRFPCQYSSPPS